MDVWCEMGGCCIEITLSRTRTHTGAGMLGVWTINYLSSNWCPNNHQTMRCNQTGCILCDGWNSSSRRVQETMARACSRQEAISVCFIACLSKEINSTIVSHYYTQECRRAPPRTQCFSIWPWAAVSRCDWTERGSYLGLIGRTITQLRWLLTILARLQTLLSSFSPSLCLESLFCPPHNFFPPIRLGSLPVAFAPLYLFLTVGQVCANAFHTMIPIYTEERS